MQCFFFVLVFNGDWEMKKVRENQKIRKKESPNNVRAANFEVA